VSDTATDLHRRALAAVKAGKDEQALLHFGLAAKLEPRSTALHLDYARFLNCLYRYRHARAHLQAARDLLPGDPKLAVVAAQLAMAGRAPQLALDWLAPFADDPAARLAAATIMERKGDVAGAAELLEGERSFGACLLRARLQSRAGDAAAAGEKLERREGPKDERAKNRQARCFAVVEDQGGDHQGDDGLDGEPEDRAA